MPEILQALLLLKVSSFEDIKEHAQFNINLPYFDGYDTPVSYLKRLQRMKQLWDAPRFDAWVSECLEQAEKITPFQRNFPISLIKFKMIDWVPKWASYIERIDHILWNEIYLVVGEKEYLAMEFDSRKLTHPTPFFVIGAIEEVAITLHS